MSTSSGSTPVPHGPHQLFFALWPDEATRAALAKATLALQAEGAQGRAVDPQRYHLTLRFLGRHATLAPAFVQHALDAAAGITAAAVELVLDRAGCFGHARVPVWLGCSSAPPELAALVEQLEAGLARHGIARETRAFVPHVTVLRDAEPVPSTRLPEPIRWRADDFVLIDSPIASTVPYRMIDRWRLR